MSHGNPEGVGKLHILNVRACFIGGIRFDAG